MREAHLQLDKRVQRWVFNQGWHGLREIQGKAIAPIMSANTDVLISASTASGKTEAFFLPACSALMLQRDKLTKENNDGHQANHGVGILYISPLKALINDQYRRLQSLAELLELPLTPWHGDSPKSGKDKQKKSPAGIILITPESLESLLVREAGWVKQAFSNLHYVVIDEFHAFLGSERGQHLVSLLTRLEHITDRLDSPIPRVALSATLGDLDSVPQALRPNQSMPCEIIEDTVATSVIKVQIKGYIEPSRLSIQKNDTYDGHQPNNQPCRSQGNHQNKSLNAKSEVTTYPSLEDIAEETFIKQSDEADDVNDSCLKQWPDTAEAQICADLYRFCRGGSHLIFANSRARTELIATELSDWCERSVVPNEFFPHHGSLSKELRESLEQRLQKESLPTTAVCTMTLELGIDIGKVDSVIQVTAPYSVSSLRQRLGRSGRRGGASVLRMLITEKELDKDCSLPDRLRLELIQSMAMIRLLIVSKWYEPADTSLYHFSTLLHQVLASIAQWGGIRADQLYILLCKHGPFQNITSAHFKTLLKQMGETNLITQLGSGQLVLGIIGERLVSHYTFYAVFKTPEEYRIVAGSKTLGTLPIDSMILPKQYIIFGGKRWLVTDVDAEKKVIDVVSVKGGGRPPRFDGSGMSIHDQVRQEMYLILANGDYRIAVGEHKVDFVDETARQLFSESMDTFHRCHLDSQAVIDQDGNTFIFTWLGDKVVNTLVALLLLNDYQAEAYAGVICVHKTNSHTIKQFLQTLVSNPLPSATHLATSVPNKWVEKYDEYLPEDLLTIGYGAGAFDIQKLQEWLKQL